MKMTRLSMTLGMLIIFSACTTPHQSNGHIAGMFGERFPETKGRVFVTADRLGNLGSAAIWSSFDELRRSGELERGQRVLILGAEASKYLYGGFVYTH